MSYRSRRRTETRELTLDLGAGVATGITGAGTVTYSDGIVTVTTSVTSTDNATWRIPVTGLVPGKQYVLSMDKNGVAGFAGIQRSPGGGSYVTGGTGNGTIAGKTYEFVADTYEAFIFLANSATIGTVNYTAISLKPKAN